MFVYLFFENPSCFSLDKFVHESVALLSKRRYTCKKFKGRVEKLANQILYMGFCTPGDRNQAVVGVRYDLQVYSVYVE